MNVRAWQLTDFTPESDKNVSLVIGGCVKMRRVEQITINTLAWMYSGCVKQRASPDSKTRSRHPYSISYQLTSTWLESKSTDTKVEKLLSRVASVNQN